MKLMLSLLTIGLDLTEHTLARHWKNNYSHFELKLVITEISIKRKAYNV